MMKYTMLLWAIAWTALRRVSAQEVTLSDNCINDLVALIDNVALERAWNSTAIVTCVLADDATSCQEDASAERTGVVETCLNEGGAVYEYDRLYTCRNDRDTLEYEFLNAVYCLGASCTTEEIRQHVTSDLHPIAADSWEDRQRAEGDGDMECTVSGSNSRIIRPPPTTPAPTPPQTWFPTSEPLAPRMPTLTLQPVPYTSDLLSPSCYDDSIAIWDNPDLILEDISCPVHDSNECIVDTTPFEASYAETCVALGGTLYQLDEILDCGTNGKRTFLNHSHCFGRSCRQPEMKLHLDEISYVNYENDRWETFGWTCIVTGINGTLSRRPESQVAPSPPRPTADNTGTPTRAVTLFPTIEPVTSPTNFPTLRYSNDTDTAVLVPTYGNDTTVPLDNVTIFVPTYYNYSTVPVDDETMVPTSGPSPRPTSAPTMAPTQAPVPRAPTVANNVNAKSVTEQSSSTTSTANVTGACLLFMLLLGLEW